MMATFLDWMSLVDVLLVQNFNSHLLLLFFYGCTTHSIETAVLVGHGCDLTQALLPLANTVHDTPLLFASAAGHGDAPVRMMLLMP